MKYKLFIGVIVLALAIISVTIYLGNQTSSQTNNQAASTNVGGTSQSTGSSTKGNTKWFGEQEDEEDDNGQINTQGAGTIGTNTNTTGQTITLVQLNSHSTAQDCWVAYQGKVYDISKWLPGHPGSAGAIIPYCGTAQEFEQAFVQQHGTRMVSMLMRIGVFIGDFTIQGTLQ